MNRDIARGLLSEFGLVMDRGDKALKVVLANLATYDLPEEFKELLHFMARQWQALEQAQMDCEARIKAHARRMSAVNVSVKSSEWGQ